jgi:hypothetical protein
MIKDIHKNGSKQIIKTKPDQTIKTAKTIEEAIKCADADEKLNRKHDRA